ncbi:aspartyl/asparaginyl beta-hydroxylase domain-containing protein [Erythrobacter rubeus]|uniref:Aspartyl/asparaginyl beta-hydroxylase domain-containing protein n=1 Tax=Erythrobacter rubeus TaxID=2760803 RepID=A0ABR8KMN3_9SPHN|nr:aspartyl/asparaginyl beta-hydroxylase domain-containing protein [Erythrobacter rubeus]MBD2841824.1 aspartyl/asparaginyl beta-hydroxylase domain-containing protein [Erythrobacter rubeus]
MAIDRPNPAMDEAEADRRLGADRRDALAMLAKADNRMLAGDHRAANAYYGQVGRLAAEGAPINRSELLRARDACEWLARRFGDVIREGLVERGLAVGDMHPRFAKSLALMLGERQREAVYVRYPQMPQMYFYPDLPHVEFADPNSAEWAAMIEAQTDNILSEAKALLAGGADFGPYVKATQDRPQGDVHGMLENSSWSTLDLTDKGAPVPERIELAPKTWSSVSENAPLCDIGNRAPSVMFSMLRAGSRIPPHTGMINTRYVCHLPLIVPGNGALRVGEQKREWEYGKLMMFDDTVEHEAWNDAATDRLVLIFDVWRPEISAEERSQIRTLFEVVDAY